MKRALLPALALVTAAILIASAAGAGASSASSGFSIQALEAEPQPIAGVTERRKIFPASLEIPEDSRFAYLAASETYDIPVALLAAIGQNESDHGSGAGPGITSGINYADCCAGPMQICIAESCGDAWSRHAQDGDRDGEASVYSKADSAMAAASFIRSEVIPIVGDDPALILAGYNAGPGAVRAAGGIPPYPETESYVARGLDLIRAIERR